jgi:uncharacterized protein (TIGR03083 family)
MALLRVDARPLLSRLRGELTALLASLPDGDWALPTPCPGWSVHDLAAHLLGAELGNVSVRRDPDRPDRPPACLARTTVDDALKLYTRDPSAAPLTWQGDGEIAAALAGVKAILG